MMSDRSRSNPLKDKPFSYRKIKNGNVSISFDNREVSLLSGKAAEKFSVRLEGVSDEEAQLLMARITGNFKRGNERLGKLRRK